jgi:hypothetical protein
MDPTRFDSLSRVLAAVGSRRALALALSGALVPLIGPGEIEARKTLKQCRKIDDKQKRKKCIKNAKKATCTDGKKNGSESDVDCGGGKCPRCQGGQTCNSRNDCHTALCVGNTCTSCIAGGCGFENDGVTGCFCRDNALKPGEKMCTEMTCTFFMGGTCALCAPGEQCAPAGGGIECCTPCGAA